MLHRPERRRGIILVLVAISLTAMLGIVAIALDGGLLLDQRRRLQSAADAAALAAAIDLLKNYPINNGLDRGGTAKASALSVASLNSYDNDGTTNSVTVNIPPSSGNYSGRRGCAEIIIQYNQQRMFSAIFGTGNIPVIARAVARGQLLPIDFAVILLDPTGSGSLQASGNGTLAVSAGAVIVDSTSSTAAVTNGNNAVLTAPQFRFGGSPGFSGNVNPPNHSGILSAQPYTVDPFLYIGAPDPASLPLQNSQTLNISGNRTATLSPGVYIGGISMAGNANVTLSPGIYYMQGGGFSVAGNASVAGAGVMIFNDNGGGSVNIAGNGSVTLSPLTSGLYQGLSVFQDRRSTAAVNLAGNGAMNLSGTVYAAAARMNVAGNGDSLGSQYVSYDLQVTGNGTVNVRYGNSTARTRIFGLVE
jgi:hypothetical protein